MNDIAGAVPATLLLATCNLLNLARPGRRFYDNQEPFSPDEYTRKIDWLGAQIRRLGADVIAFQEVWDEAALRDAVAASGQRYAHLAAPGAEQGAEGTSRLGIASRWPLRELTSHRDFAAAQHAAVPDLGEQRAFDRPVPIIRIETSSSTISMSKRLHSSIRSNRSFRWIRFSRLL